MPGVNSTKKDCPMCSSAPVLDVSKFKNMHPHPRGGDTRICDKCSGKLAAKMHYVATQDIVADCHG